MPSAHERQLNATGITYPDPSMQTTLVGGTAHRTHQIDSGYTRRNVGPSVHKVPSFGPWDYGFITTSTPQTEVISHLDFRPITRVGWMSSYAGTEHPGFYLDVKK